MDAAKKKALLSAYKSRTVIGGVYCIVCSGNGRRWLRAATDLNGVKNRFEQSVRLKGAPEPAMFRELNDYGAGSFSLVVLEQLQKADTQSDKDFADDIRMLYEIWLEKTEPQDLDG